jgi:8-oxo-dGTP diphosphatase
MEDGDYPRPMLTADVVVFAGAAEAPHVLLIQRGNPPFAGSWALPGGFVEEGKQVADAAPRELVEETGLKVDVGVLELLGVYDTPGRDPRGWTVSVVYIARVPAESAVAGADDASDARWFAVEELPELAFDHALIVADARAFVAEPALAAEALLSRWRRLRVVDPTAFREDVDRLLDASL